MTNKILEEYLARVRAELHTLADEERDTIIDEMRGHLEEAITQRMAAEPYTDLEAITLAETRAFGEPAEIGASRAPRPIELPPTKKGRGKVLRWVLGAAAVALVVLIALSISLNMSSGPSSFSSTPYYAHLEMTNDSGGLNETFLIPEGSTYFQLTARVDRSEGCLGLRVTDPRGTVVLDEWGACGGIRNTITVEPARTGQFGTWRVEARYSDFTGELNIMSNARAPRP